MGLTHCYKTAVFYIYLSVRQVRAWYGSGLTIVYSPHSSRIILVCSPLCIAVNLRQIDWFIVWFCDTCIAGAAPNLQSFSQPQKYNTGRWENMCVRSICSALLRDILIAGNCTIDLLIRDVRCAWELGTRGQSNLTKSASRGPIPRLGVTPEGRNLYHWISGVGFPISVP